jgi:predicted SnoaL-like aldol condensation-catalyzing enzyme
MRGSNQKKVEIIHAFLMRMIAKNVQAKPLYRMKYKQNNPEYQVVSNRQDISDYFHDFNKS